MDISTFEYQNLGLDGAILDARTYFESETEYMDKFVKHLISKYNYDSDQIEKIMGRFIIGRPKEVQDMEQIYSNAKKLIR